ncbi:MAG: DRTGG domain-containing protein [Christensenellaceae bacterium]|jgi:predicted transcriptional regulator
MTVQEIKNILEAEICSREDMLGREVHTACGSDMMSDVLAYVKDQSVLLSGTVNPQVIRTAEMMDMVCIVFVRGKQPTPEMLELAADKDICVLSTKYPMFTACGKLYEKGLRGGGECEWQSHSS